MQSFDGVCSQAEAWEHEKDRPGSPERAQAGVMLRPDLQAIAEFLSNRGCRFRFFQ
jgi:hypothetical protein